MKKKILLVVTIIFIVSCSGFSSVIGRNINKESSSIKEETLVFPVSFPGIQRIQPVA